MGEGHPRGGYRDPARPAPEPVDPRQAQLDRHFGVSAGDRALLERGCVPLRFRASSGVRAALWLALALAIPSAVIALALRGEAAWGLLACALPSSILCTLPLLLWAIQHARAAIPGRCSMLEGGAHRRSYLDEQGMQRHELHLSVVPMSMVPLRVSPGLASVVREADPVRVYYCPHRLTVYALEPLDEARSPEHPRSHLVGWWSDGVLEDFRRELH